MQKKNKGRKETRGRVESSAKSNFLIFISLQPDGANLLIFQI